MAVQAVLCDSKGVLEVQFVFSASAISSGFRWNETPHLIRQVEYNEGEVYNIITCCGKNHTRLTGKVMLYPLMKI